MGRRSVTGRSRSVRHTHRSIAVAGLNDTGKMTQANSVSPIISHFFPLESVENTVNGWASFRDLITGNLATVVNDHNLANGDLVAAGVTPYTVSILSSDGGNINLPAYPPAENKNLLLMWSGKAVDSGSMAFDLIGVLTCRPLRIIVVATMNKWQRTIQYCHLGDRIAGQDYTIASMLRGDYIEHYVYDNLIDEYLLVESNYIGDAIDGFSGLTFPVLSRINLDGIEAAAFQISHTNSVSDVYGESSRTAPPGCGGTLSNGGDTPQEYYAHMGCLFAQDNSPSVQQILDALKFVREEWPKGNKVIPPQFAGFA